MTYGIEFTSHDFTAFWLESARARTGRETRANGFCLKNVARGACGKSVARKVESEARLRVVLAGKIEIAAAIACGIFRSRGFGGGRCVLGRRFAAFLP